MNYRRFSCILAVLVAHCARTHESQLRVVNTNEGPSGFTCREENGVGAPLARRALATSGDACVVVDFVPLADGTPTCDPGVLVSYCEQHRCAPDLRARARLPLRLTAAMVEDPRLAAEVLTQLTGQQVIANAPDGPVVVRTVAIAGSCDSVVDGADGAFPCNTLIGCAYSCPVLLDQVSEVLLGLPTTSASTTCEATVNYCANLTSRCAR